MRMSELTETPQSTEPTTFNLDDPVINKAFAAREIKRVIEVLEDTDDYKMVKTGDGQRGWIFLYNIHNETADYVIQYQTKNWSWMTKTVTQCVLWRNVASPFVRGATVRMFFGYLLQHYPSIMSDRIQTANGHDFWIARMADAINKNYRVGIVNMNTHSIDWFDPSTTNIHDFQSWMSGQETFGQSERYQAIRYLISN